MVCVHAGEHSKDGGRLRKLALDFGQLWMTPRRITENCGTSSRLARPKPSQIISHELPLHKAPEGYQHFDEREKGCTEVVEMENQTLDTVMNWQLAGFSWFETFTCTSFSLAA